MNSGAMAKIVLSDLGNGDLGITRPFGEMLAEAGAVCFEGEKHQNGVILKVRGDLEAEYEVFWQQVSARMQATYADEQFATEYGAYGVALLLVFDNTGKIAIARSRKGTGFDFWLGTQDDDEGLPFQNKERLEVSGIRRGADSGIGARVREKKEQVKRSEGLGLPAIIVVVEFSRPISQVIRRG